MGSYQRQQAAHLLKNMKVIAAYMLAVVGGNAKPSVADCKNILGAVGIELEADAEKRLVVLLVPLPLVVPLVPLVPLRKRRRRSQRRRKKWPLLLVSSTMMVMTIKLLDQNGKAIKCNLDHEKKKKKKKKKKSSALIPL